VYLLDNTMPILVMNGLIVVICSTLWAVNKLSAKINRCVNFFNDLNNYISGRLLVLVVVIVSAAYINLFSISMIEVLLFRMPKGVIVPGEFIA
jgi:hypothetical protein